jgi:hypothetical protein
VIHFHINSQHLVLTIVTVAPVSKPPSIKKSSSFHVGTVFEHGNSYYEVTTQLQLQAVIPWLLDVIRCLRETKDLIQDFRNKVYSFNVILIIIIISFIRSKYFKNIFDELILYCFYNVNYLGLKK